MIRMPIVLSLMNNYHQYIFVDINRAVAEAE